MSEMIERVAVAIALADMRRVGVTDPLMLLAAETLAASREDALRLYGHIARAAIEALREPSEAMVHAAWADTGLPTPDERMALELCRADVAFKLKMRRRHRVMIDAALQPAGPKP